MLMKIGEFSKLSRVSVRMLRHYDEIGLLKPAETDPWTDYRYYRADQLPTMCRIAALKDIGFFLAVGIMFATGGSDFHGKNKPDIFLGSGKNNLAIPYAFWENLKKRTHR